jgi:hypothetical protein
VTSLSALPLRITGGRYDLPIAGNLNGIADLPADGSLWLRKEFSDLFYGFSLVLGVNRCQQDGVTSLVFDINYPRTWPTIT